MRTQTRIQRTRRMSLVAVVCPVLSLQTLARTPNLTPTLILTLTEIWPAGDRWKCCVLSFSNTYNHLLWCLAHLSVIYYSSSMYFPPCTVCTEVEMLLMVNVLLHIFKSSPRGRETLYSVTDQDLVLPKAWLQKHFFYWCVNIFSSSFCMQVACLWGSGRVGTVSGKNSLGHEAPK